MKTLSCTSALLAGFLALTTSVHADFLSAIQPISVTGNVQIVTESTDETKAGTVKNSAATIANILKTLSITGQNPKKLAYYYDSTTDAVVIADRAIPSTGSTGTPVATVLAYASAVSWSKSPNEEYRGGDCTTLGSLPGTFTRLTVEPALPMNGKVKAKSKKVKDTTTFITWGVTNNLNVIFKGVITGVIKITGT